MDSKQSLNTLQVPRALRFREAAYLAIKEAILDGRLAGSEPLIEERIASSLGISRTPVREALAILDHEGLIAPRSGKGLYIREITREAFLDMFSANEVIEPYLARRAAVMATSEHLTEIEAAIERGIVAARDLDLHASLRSGREFHLAMGRAARNESLTQLVVRNEEQTDLYLLSLSDPLLISGANMQESNQEHLAIFDAIRQRDSEAAARHVIVHAHSLRTRWIPLFRSEAPASIEAQTL